MLIVIVAGNVGIAAILPSAPQQLYNAINEKREKIPRKKSREAIWENALSEPVTTTQTGDRENDGFQKTTKISVGVVPTVQFNF